MEDRRLLSAISIGDATVDEDDARGKVLDVFAAVDNGEARTTIWGPDGNSDGLQDLYVATGSGNKVVRYDGSSGTLIDVFVGDDPVTTDVDESGGLNFAIGLAFGADANQDGGEDLYVSSRNTNQVLRYDGRNGQFIDVFVGDDPSTSDIDESGGLSDLVGIVFGPADDLFAVSRGTDSVLRYQAGTGAFLGVYVGDDPKTADVDEGGGLDDPHHIVFGPGGYLYVPSQATNNVLKYDQDGTFLGEFISGSTNITNGLGHGGLEEPKSLAFSDDGHVYVDNAKMREILRYNATTGEFSGVFVPRWPEELDGIWHLNFGPDGYLYVSGSEGKVFRCGPASQATFTVKLSAPSSLPVTVDFSTADDTALAGSDYQATSGTLTFAPGETSKTIIVPTIDNALLEAPETFLVVLSNPSSGDTILDDQGVGTIVELTTTTYVGSSTPIKDDSLTATRLFVSDSYTIWDLNVQLDVTHSNVGELVLSLARRSENIETSIVLLSAVGGDGDNFDGTVLDDEALMFISEGTAPFDGSTDDSGGRYRPYSYKRLSRFDGQDINGKWELLISDRVRGNKGTLNSWSLIVSHIFIGATPGITVDPTSGLLTTEDGGTDSFTVVLDSQPTAPVTIDISSNNTSEGSVGPASLTFDSVNWNTPQTVTVTGVDDSIEDGDVAYTVVLAPTSSIDPDYNGINPADVSVINQDNDAPAGSFESQDVPQTIADPHPKRGPKPATSELVINSTGITVDLIDVDVSIDHLSMSDLTVFTLTSPSNTEASLAYDGANWDLVNAAAFSGESLDGTWLLAVTDTVKNGITGTLTAWSITVTPGSAAASSQSAAAFDMALAAWAEPDSSDDEDADPLATQAADELALMMME